MTAQRADRRWLMARVIIGYLAIWGAFGLAAHLLDWALSSFIRQSDWLIAADG